MIKKYRIRKNEEFSRIIAQKHTLVSDCFVIHFDTKKEDYSRIGISVSKKLGDAVTRNKIKRQIRMIFAQSYDYESGIYDFIVIARNPIKEKTFEEKRIELEKLIKKAII